MKNSTLNQISVVAGIFGGVATVYHANHPQGLAFAVAVPIVTVVSITLLQIYSRWSRDATPELLELVDGDAEHPVELPSPGNDADVVDLDPIDAFCTEWGPVDSLAEAARALNANAQPELMAMIQEIIDTELARLELEEPARHDTEPAPPPDSSEDDDIPATLRNCDLPDTSNVEHLDEHRATEVNTSVA